MRQMSRKVSLTVICDGKSQLIFYNTLPYATMSPLAASEKSKIESAYEDPLMEVFSYFEGFPTSPDISVRSSSGTEVNGRATYVIEARRKDNHHSLRVVVDKASELPIESIFSNPTQNFESERKTEYAYNKSYPDSLFSISNTKEIVNAKREQSILAKKWTQPKLDTKTTPVYESSISPDGTIWICFGEDNTSYVKSAPAEVICDGVKYVGAFDWSSEYSSTGQGFLVNKKAMMISAFVPIHEPTGRPTTATIRFGAIDRNKRDFFPAPPSGASEMRVELNLDKHDFPDYARPFGFDHMARNLSTPLWHAKALAREKESDLLGAAQAYEQEAEACKQFVEYVAFRPLREAARLYEMLGQLDKATELRSRADELERTRIR